MRREVLHARLRRAAGIWSLWLFCGTIAAWITAIVLRRSLARGRLAALPTYDDVYYMAQGARWLARWRGEGAWGVFREYLVRPPHSPISVGAAGVSFAVLGFKEWAPYLANGLVVLLYLLLGSWLFRATGRWQRIAGICLTATIPMVAKAAHEFRPDAAAAGFQAMGIVLIFAGRVTGCGRRLLGAGVAFGASLLCKPSVFVASGLLLAASLGAACVAEWVSARPRPKFRELLAPVAAFAAGLLGMAALYPPSGWRHQWGYFYANIAGSNAPYWAGTEGWATHFLWYLTGSAGWTMLGWHVALLSAVIVAGVAVGAKAGGPEVRARAAALACVLCMTYMMASLNRMKSEFLGLPFQALFAAAGLSSLAFMVRTERAARGRAIWSSAALMVALGIGLVMFRWPRPWSTPDSPGNREHRRVAGQIYEAVRSASEGRGGRVHITSVGLVNSNLFEFWSLRDGAGLEFSEDPYIGSIAQLETRARGFDLIVANTSGMPAAYITEQYGTAQRFPFAAIQDQTIEALDKGGEFARVASVRVEPGLGTFVVFKRRDTFAGWEALSGLRNTEGPYPQWKLPVVRWGLAPSTVLAMRGGGRYRFTAVGRSGLDGQRVNVQVDGRDIASADMARGQWTRVGAEMNLEPGDHRVEIGYARSKDEADGRAVLFRSIIIEPVMDAP